MAEETVVIEVEVSPVEISVVDEVAVQVSVLAVGDTGPAGPAGGGANLSGEASEAISALRAVRTLPDGRFALYSPVSQPDGAPSGVSQTAGSSGDDITVVPGGILTVEGANFTPGSRYWVKESGVLTATLSEVVGLASIVEIGIALDADSLMVRIYPGIRNP